MPPRFPPTPAASGELHIKDHPIDSMAEHSFALPPAALSPVATDDSNSSNTSHKASLVFQTPVSPASPDIAGRRMSTASSRVGSKRAAASAALDEFNLPPPPTRTRKIIQMKPKPASSSTGAAAGSTATQSASKSIGKSSTTGSKPAATGAASTPSSSSAAAASSQQPTNANGSKKKQPSATSAAGRKIARKTAHSLIERRRRSKMNEEFSTLKNMIPACRGQEMHKLAILQASIDYMNYLEECITELKSASSGKNTTNTPIMRAPPGPPSPTSPELVMPERADEESFSASSSASSVAASPALSPHTGPTHHHHQFQSIDSSSSSSYYPILPSPALGPVQHPNNNINNNNTWRTPSQPLASATPSPAILPQQHHRYSVSSSTSTSGAALENDSSIDHEASAALLMLNMDRRSGPAAEESAQRSSLAAEATARQRKMGMSVRDLLAP
ncbi:hypothetical protein PISL3812_02111 [Talaromyces islandicus]|uniref:BHLH domain-containing protein n=1 Tax=Talaromyces islandicus TaxID=28573 RepID=A0A0U1LR86_TALIS|nr:hypothetical protein PISL3812_02111 [Talaromyces islandicus]